MQHFSEIGTSYEEAEFLVRKKYGASAHITGHQKILKGGFLGLGGKTVYEISGFVKNKLYSQPLHIEPDLPSLQSKHLQKTKSDILNASGVNDPSTMVKILDHIKALRSEVQEQNGTKASEHNNIQHVYDLLEENEFSRSFIKNIADKIRGLSLEEIDDRQFLQKRVLSWISGSILVGRELPRSSPRIMVLVGPTGVGKTTTIAKLAGLFSMGHGETGREQSVRIIASDHYRIGALEQIETYANIMKVPIERAAGTDELKRQIAFYKNADIIFIDTPGRGPNDFENIAKLNSFLHSAGAKLEIYLTLSATSRISNIMRTIQQYEALNLTSCIITKTDEVSSLGAIISALWEKNKDVSYISFGQSVPGDIMKAKQEYFLKSLSGFLVFDNSKKLQHTI